MGDGIITSFSRYEVKYFLTQEQLHSLMPILLEHMSVDDYGQHTISNIYFDTERFNITRNSIEKPVFKEKLRVRAYGKPDPETGRVFVELKKKYQHIVYKRRIMLTVPESNAFLLGGVVPTSSDPQITREIAHFMNRNRPVPQVFLSYDRVALFGREDPELRITFDTNLLWRETDLDLCAGAYGDPVLPDNHILMEVKIPGTTPLWLAHAFSALQIRSTSFSKIGTCYTRFILPEKFSNKVVNAYV